LNGTRILYVINGFDPGGAEHGLLTLIQVGFFDGRELKVLGFCKGRGDLAERIGEAIGADNLLIAKDGEALSAGGLLRGGVALFALLRRWRPDAVVLSLKQANVVGRAVLCLFPGIRCISFEHIARYRARRGERLYGMLLWLISFRVDGIWADCRETLEATRAYFTRRSRHEAVVPLFVAAASMPRKTDYALGDAVRLATAGRLVDRKNVDAIIEVVKMLKERGVDARLDIFGDGPEMAHLQALTARHGLGGAVRFHGYRADWLNEAAAHDVFINMGDTEGFCIVAAEAMSAGLPVVAVDVGGIREYGVHLQNMIKLEAVDRQRLASVLERLLDDEDMRRRIGERARADMLAAYSIDALRECGQRMFSTLR
jgi:glycosyltransferase involved in cell wall biosynthesis